MRKIFSLLAACFMVTAASLVFSVSQIGAAEPCPKTPSECCDDPPYEGCELQAWSCESNGTSCTESCTWHCPGS